MRRLMHCNISTKKDRLAAISPNPEDANADSVYRPKVDAVNC
jgi:hypothetical protein